MSELRHMPVREHGPAVRAELRLLPTDEGGRKDPMLSGYRSLVRFGADEQDIGFEWHADADPLRPGRAGTGRLEFWALDDPSPFTAGHEFEVREGSRVIGYGTVIDDKP
jgi:translation elongation factor EF-Tu-like GTPase